MKKSEYSEQLKDPRWQEFRLRVFERDGFKCTTCGDSQSTLHAHHIYYISGRSPWNYPKGCVITLCNRCHEQEHAGSADWFSPWEEMVASTPATGELADFMATVHLEAIHRDMSAVEVMDAICFSIQNGKINAKECAEYMVEKLNQISMESALEKEVK